MKNISFSLTIPQFRARTKTVTRRLSWLNLRPGDVLMGCEKCMGRKPGEPLVKLGPIEIVSVRREPLFLMVTQQNYGEQECIKEGFPEMTPGDFCWFFAVNHGMKLDDLGMTDELVTRIEFKYLPSGCPNDTDGDGDCHLCHRNGRCKWPLNQNPER